MLDQNSLFNYAVWALILRTEQKQTVQSFSTSIVQKTPVAYKYNVVSNCRMLVHRDRSELYYLFMNTRIYHHTKNKEIMESHL